MKIKLILFSLAFALPVAAQTVVYVDRRAVAGNDEGSSWQNAYLDLGYAIDAAAGLAPAEIWVAEGRYRPTTVSDRGVSIMMAEGVDLYGGFAGTETNRSESDPAAHPTILSSDLRRNDDTVDNMENSIHVLQGAGVTFKMDGFTISGGNAAGASGGGFVGNGSATFSRCIFRNNVASTGGGAIFWSGPSLALEDCQFISNQAVGGIGGGSDWMRTVLYRPSGAVFVDNKASLDNGGAVGTSNPTITMDLLDCAFRGNQSGSDGGAISMLNGLSMTLTATNCEFTGNHAGSNGGAFFASTTITSIRFINCVFSGNRAVSDGGAVWASNPELSNSIVWSNSANGSTATPGSSLFANTIAISHSLIENWNPPGTGNIDGTDPANAPLFLTTIDPAAAPTADSGDLSLQPGSPALTSATMPPTANPSTSRGSRGFRTPPLTSAHVKPIPVPRSGFSTAREVNLPTMARPSISARCVLKMEARPWSSSSPTLRCRRFPVCWQTSRVPMPAA